MNNYQNIKQMSVEEMTEFIYRYASYLDLCCRCPIFEYCNNCKKQSKICCEEVIKTWLENPQEDKGE